LANSVLAITSCPDSAVATALARALVEEKLAACVTRMPGARSVYRWQGNIEEADEVVCFIKTTSERVDELRTRLVALHPYEVPELIVLDITGGLPAYLAWIAAETSPPPDIE
jgi:periplasmic divalent cation tolerance protein